MSDKTELLPCPFCGSKPLVIRRVTGTYGVDCGNEDCLVMPFTRGGYETKLKAIAAWNRRATHGTPTAELVREAVARHGAMLRGCVWQIQDASCDVIADELNATLGNWTCEMVTSWEIRDELGIADAPEDTWGYKCSACEWLFRYERGIKPNYCPNCGRKVIDADKENR